MRFIVRISVALILAAMAFIVGLYLPLSIMWFVRGDPGMPGGAGLIILGFPVGVVAGIVVGLFSFIKWASWGEFSK